MKKIVASVGLVALGVSGVEAAAVPEDGAGPSKPWSVSATLRGFYDDNINAASEGSGLKEDSFGYEISPSALLTWTLEQTSISLGYVYSLRYFENKPAYTTGHDSQSHTFNGTISHAFSERYRGTVSDSFVLGHEPDLLRAGNILETYQPIPGDNIRNFGSITFDAQMTRVFGLQLGYANTFFDYADDTVTILTSTVGTNTVGTIQPSRAGSLNQISQSVHLDGRWLLQPPTTGVLGYQFSDLDFIGNQVIGGTFLNDVPVGPFLRSDDRNSRTHYGYVGVDHTFRPDFSGSLRVGALSRDYYNDPNSSSELSPYVQASLRYTYTEQSYAEAGFTYDRSSTDLVGFSGTGNDFTKDAETAVVYGSVNHRITAKLFGSVTAQFQNSTYNGGQFDGQTDRFYLVGLNLEYRFTPHFSGHVGYNYDRLDSDLAGRSFDRNRVYMGLTASY